VFHLFGALAQFEREIIRDRTVAGLTAARARGRVGGRPFKLSVEQVRQARKMYDARELTVEQIGKVLGVSRTSIYRALGKTTTQVPSTSAAPAPGRIQSRWPWRRGRRAALRRWRQGGGVDRRGAGGDALAGPVALVRGGGRPGRSRARAGRGGQRSHQPEGGDRRVGPGQARGRGRCCRSAPPTRLAPGWCGTARPRRGVVQPGPPP